MLLNLSGLVTLVGFGFKFKERITQNLMRRKGKARIVFFGDSIIKNGPWNKILNRSDVLISGPGGFTTSHLIWCIKKGVVSYDPRVCFMGANQIVA